MKNNKNKGFTLIETVLAIAVLGIIVAAFSPVFANILKNYYFNQSRLLASNIASRELEEVRYMIIQNQYEEIGTELGNPTGDIKQSKYVTENGNKYQVNTNINWEDEEIESDGTTIYDAFKKIDVTVFKVDNNNIKTGPSVTHSSLVAREGESVPSKKASLKVNVKKYIENPTGGTTNPSFGADQDTKIELSEILGSFYQYGYSDEEGKKIFADLEPGNGSDEDYAITIDPSSGLMLPPTGVSSGNWIFDDTKNIATQEYGRYNKTFYISEPSYLSIDVIDKNSETNEKLDFSTHGGLDFVLDVERHEDLSNIEYSFTANSQADLESKLNTLDLYPGYNNYVDEDTGNVSEYKYSYNIKIKSHDTGNILYDTEDDEDSWDGLFDEAGESINLEIKI